MAEVGGEGEGEVEVCQRNRTECGSNEDVGWNIWNIPMGIKECDCDKTDEWKTLARPFYSFFH